VSHSVRVLDRPGALGRGRRRHEARNAGDQAYRGCAGTGPATRRRPPTRDGRHTGRASGHPTRARAGHGHRGDRTRRCRVPAAPPWFRHRNPECM